MRERNHRRFSQNGSDGSSQGSFTMVNVADSTNVDVRFCTFKFSLDTAIFLTIVLSLRREHGT